MEFGRVADLSVLEGFDAALPPEPAGNAELLATYALPGAGPRLHVGAPVWAHEKLRSRLSPPGEKGAAALARYAQAFGSLELNSTFYSDAAADLERIASATPPEFGVAAKLPRAISHDLRLQSAEAEVERFVGALQALGPRRGPAWLLVPPGFGPAEFSNLERFVEAHAHALRPLAIELREPEWFSEPRWAARVAELFELHGVAWVLTDVIGRRDVLHMRLTAPYAFVRFTGNRLHESDHRRLDAWLERLAVWFRSGLREAWLFLHQPEEGLVIELGQQVADRSRELFGLEIVRPEPLPVERQHSMFE